MTDMPDLWWSPTHGLIEREDGLIWLLTKGPLLEDGDAPLPADAIKLDRDRGTDYIRVGETIATKDRSDVYTLVRGDKAMHLEPLDTGQTHVIELNADGWTMKHPVTCRAKLFDCPVHAAALKSDPLSAVPFGRYTCAANYDGFLAVGEATT